jgi:hypothetical protein
MRRHNSRQTQYCDFCQLQARWLDPNLAEPTASFCGSARTQHCRYSNTQDDLKRKRRNVHGVQR